MSRLRPALALAALGALVAAAACASEEGGPCRSDGDCPAGGACREGVCVCATDEACPAGRFCNHEGICQLREGCASNEDCRDGQICDVLVGTCVAAGACSVSLQCPLGEICVGAACLPGCVTAADCPLGSACTAGQCDPSRCPESTFCPVGQECRDGVCGPAADPAHCAPCEGHDYCGADGFCSANPLYPRWSAESGQCHVRCDAGSCPGGYVCEPLHWLTERPCRGDEGCGPGRTCEAGSPALPGQCTCLDAADCSDVRYRPSCIGTCSGGGSCWDDRNCGTGTCDARALSCLFPRGRICSEDTDCEVTPLCVDQFDAGRPICLRPPYEECRTSADCLCGEDGRCLNTRRACSSAADCALPCVSGRCDHGSVCQENYGFRCEDYREAH